MFRRLLSAVVVGACALLATTTHAQTTRATTTKATERYAVLVAAHDGGPGLPKLRYAARDAQRLQDVLVDVGGFADNDILVLVDGDAAAMRDLLDDLRARVQGSKTRGDDVVVVVYYSGHASEGRLHLGTTRFEMRELRQRVEALGADVRLAFVDSCGAGAITREKGATLAAPFVITADQNSGVGATGQVIIASSSADEVSQESDEIQGSFFTHHLTTGLRGDADRDHDGVVTLDEAYAYAYGRTVAATAATRSGAQHPTYAFDLQGAGDVVLSRPGGADVVVEFPGELEGRYFVVDLDRQLFVAEVDKQKGGTSQIALPRGQYAIKKRLDSHLLMTRVQARSKGRIVVDDGTMQSVAFADDYAKGSPLGINQIDDTVRFSFAVGAVVTGVADPSGFDDGGLFPTTAGPQLRLRWNNLLRHRIALDLDASIGVARAVRTIDAGPAFGGITHLDVNVVATQMGASAVWLQPILDGAVDVGVGPRVVGVLFTHRFVGDNKPVGLDGQSYVSFNPGVVGVVSWHFTSWAHLELDARAHYLPYTVDQLRHLVSLEGMLSVWVDL